VVGCTYPGAVYVKYRRGSSKERGVPRRRPRPSCSTAPARNPNNEQHQDCGYEAGEKREAWELGWRR
jgi:hypothetical protein